jgi:hypothetical protein
MKHENVEIQKLIDEITKEAKKVVEDYAKNPSEDSGSEYRIAAESPYLDEFFEGDSWKTVVYSDSLNDEEFIKKIKSLRDKKKLGKKN